MVSSQTVVPATLYACSNLGKQTYHQPPADIFYLNILYHLLDDVSKLLSVRVHYLLDSSEHPTFFSWVVAGLIFSTGTSADGSDNIRTNLLPAKHLAMLNGEARFVGA